MLLRGNGTIIMTCVRAYVLATRSGSPATPSHMEALVWQLEGVDIEAVRGDWSKACVSQGFRGIGPRGPDCSIWALALYELCLNDGSVPRTCRAHTSVRVSECCTPDDLRAVMETVGGGDKDRGAACDKIWRSATLVARAVNISDLTRAQLERRYVCVFEAGYTNAGLVDFTSASYSCDAWWDSPELRSDIAPMGTTEIVYNRPSGTEGLGANEVFHVMLTRRRAGTTSKQATYGFHWSHMYGPSSDGGYHCYPHVGHPGQWTLFHTTKISSGHNRASVIDCTSGYVAWRPYFVSPERKGQADTDMGHWSGTRRPLATLEYMERHGELVLSHAIGFYATSGTCVGERTDACLLGVHGFEEIGAIAPPNMRLVVGGGGPLTEKFRQPPVGEHMTVFSRIRTISWILDALSLPYCVGLLYILVVGHDDGSLSFAGYATIIGEVVVEVASRLMMCTEALRSDGSNSGPYSVVSAAIAPIAWSLSDFAEVSEERKWVRRSPMRLEALSAIVTMGAIGTIIEDGRGGTLATFLLTGAGLLVGAVGAKADIVLEAVGSREDYSVTRVMVGYACLYFSGMVLQAYIILIEGVSFVSSIGSVFGVCESFVAAYSAITVMRMWERAAAGDPPPEMLRPDFQKGIFSMFPGPLREKLDIRVLSAARTDNKSWLPRMTSVCDYLATKGSPVTFVVKKAWHSVLGTVHVFVAHHGEGCSPIRGELAVVHPAQDAFFDKYVADPLETNCGIQLLKERGVRSQPGDLVISSPDNQFPLIILGSASEDTSDTRCRSYGEHRNLDTVV